MSKELTKIEKRVFQLMCDFGDKKGKVAFNYWRRYSYNGEGVSFYDILVEYAYDIIHDEFTTDIGRAMRRVREENPDKFPKSKKAIEKEEVYRDHYSPKANKMIQGAFI